MNEPFQSSIAIPTESREVTMSAVVIRCGCGDPDSHNGVRGPAGVCPRPRRTDDLGTVAYYHRSPLRRFIWAVVGARLSALRTHISNRS